MEDNNEILNKEILNKENTEEAITEETITEETVIIKEMAVSDEGTLADISSTEETAASEANAEKAASVEEVHSEEQDTEEKDTEEIAQDEMSAGEENAENPATGEIPGEIDTETQVRPAETDAETEEVSAEMVAEMTAGEEASAEEVPTEEAPAEEAPKKPRKKRTKKTEEQAENEEPALPKPDCPEAAIEAVLFATGNSVSVDQLAEILNMKTDEVRTAVANLKVQYDSENRGITITELEDSVQLGTKGEYYEYLMKLAKHPKHYSLSDTVIETLSIIAYKQPVTRGEIEKIRGVSCDHAINKLLEYELIEEVGRLDAPGKPLLFGTTEQFLRSFGVKSIGELPTVSPEMVEDFKVQAEAEAAEDLELENVKVDV